jgi:hypothetical protein
MAPRLARVEARGDRELVSDVVVKRRAIRRAITPIMVHLMNALRR